MNQETTDVGMPGGEMDVGHELTELAGRARETIEDFVQERPHAALGLAAALGFVIGGGLTPRRLIRLGFAAGGPLLSRELISHVVRLASEGLGDSAEEGSKAGRKSPRKRAPSH